MNKRTSIRIPASSRMEAYAHIYGSVSNGVTTITKIGDIENIIGTTPSVPKSSFASYILINGTKYNWVIDSYDSSGNVSAAHVNISGTITISNIFFSWSDNFNNEELYETFYSKNPDTHDTYFGLNATVGNVSKFTATFSGIVNGSNSVSCDYSYYESSLIGTTLRDGLLSVGDTYRFTWELGSRTFSQDVVATSQYSMSASHTIPIAWCDQIIYPDGSPENPGLFSYFYLIVNGKSTYEWAVESYGHNNDAYFEHRNLRQLAINAGLSVDSSLLPSISSVIIADTNSIVPSSWSEYIQHLSNVAVSAIDASGIYGSTIDKVSISVGADTAIKASGTLSSLPATRVIDYYGTFDVDVTVTDSRNRTATKSSKITFLSYSAPTISDVVSRRCTENGIIDNDGTFVKVSGTPNVYSCNGKNSYHVYVSYKRTDESNYSAEQEVTLPATIGTKDATTKLGNFDPEYSYDIRYRITDAINSVYYVDYVSTAIMMMHFMRGGRGVAFGQKATIEYCVDTSFNALFRGNVGFEINKKFYTIEQIINALNITGVDSLSWVENNKKEF